MLLGLNGLRVSEACATNIEDRPSRRPQNTTIYDRHGPDFDRHAAYVVVAFVAGG